MYRRLGQESSPNLANRPESRIPEIAEKAQALYQAQVAKRTGALSESAVAYTEIGGMKHDRHIGVLHVGGTVSYAASHEFGTTHGVHPAHDLNRVLEELAGL